ncbi:MAG TPA: folylpolyglutamate synthase/dihydrofolate synthase family protein [Candidatus Acidoferrales bacterium]|nr:folylpolyglutamate synthase/dihydrofolate synthase family protein [Candidatus Acidoferrales bacterium]
MTYQEAVRYLLTLGRELASPQQARAAKFDLRNITLLAERLGNPQNSYPSVHIAGTNGKGTTAAMLASILRSAGQASGGLRTGLYTSPHLERMNERIRLDSEEIADADFATTFTRIHARIEELLATGPEPSGLAAHPTYFECLTAMAFDFFARRQVDFAVFEVGMGGRLDATNIVRPEVAVITQIDFDHENFLGHSIEQIAAEKAGIIKPGGWVVSAAEHPAARAVIAHRAAELDARLVETNAAYRVEGLRAAAGGYYRAAIASAHSSRRIELELPLAGRFQVRNALAALAAARLLAERGFPLDDLAIARGIRSVRWPGRLERVSEHPDVYLDGTHNPSGARELLAFWDEHLRGRPIHLVYGAMRDKAVDEITGLLFPRATTIILTEPRQPRAISAGVLATMTRHLSERLEVVAEPEAALEHALALASPDDAVFATGSLYLVGDLRHWWFGRHRTQPAATGRVATR